MEETVEVVGDVVKQTHANKLGKVVFSAVVGYAASQVAEKLYDKLITEGRLKLIFKRNK